MPVLLQLLSVIGGQASAFQGYRTGEEGAAVFLNHKVPQVKFVDRTFNCKHDHSIAIWKYIMEHDNGITNFHFEIAADILNEEELELLEQMRPGLVQLEIGVQSTNPKTIKEIHRVMDFEKVSKIVRRIQDKGNVHEHLDRSPAFRTKMWKASHIPLMMSMH